MCHHTRVPRAFTLVELLVVIAIIGVLVGLLLPAINGAREAGRRTTCMNNQYHIALACTRFNDTNGFLPGWRNALASTSITPSWPVMALPFMERMDVYRAWSSGNTQAPYISVFVCPSTPPDATTSPWLAYAGNGGVGRGVNYRSTAAMVDTLITSERHGLDDI